MPWVRPAVAGLGGVVAATCLSASAGVEPTEDRGSQLRLSAAIGAEHQSAPIFRIDPEGAVLLLPGRQQVDSHHVEWDAQAFVDGPLALGSAWRWAVAGSFKLRQARPNKALNLGIVTFEPMLSRSTASGTLGLAVTGQQLSSGGEVLRLQRGLRADWTVASDARLQSWSLELAKPRYAKEFIQLDSRQLSLGWLLRQDLHKGPLSQVMVALNVQREGNQRDQPELSSRAGSAQLQLQGPLGRVADVPLQWTLNLMRQIQRFDASAFSDAARRRDRWTSLDLGLSWALTDSTSLQAELNLARNRSTLAPYQLDYRQLGLRIASSW